MAGTDNAERDHGHDAEPDRSPARGDTVSTPRLGSRILVTWVEVTLVGITGGLLGGAVGGPPGFVIYLATTLVTIGIIFYNVNELIKAWVRTTSRT